MQQHFSQRWSVEYLNKLQQSAKWPRTVKNLDINEMVLIKEDNAIPLSWPLGRIVQDLPGADGKA